MKNAVLVYAEVRYGRVHPVSYELTGKARQLADKLETQVSTVIFYDELNTPPEQFFAYGADEVIIVKDDCFHHFNQEIHTNVLSAIIEKEEPQIVLTGATSSGRTVLPAVAGKVNTGLTADCTGLDIEEGTGLLLQTRPAIGGNIMATIKTPNHRPQMSTVRPKTFEVPEKEERTGIVKTFDLTDEMKATRIETLGFEPLDGANENIQEQEVIVAGGKGLKRKEGFELLERLAKLLNGGVGASRPPIEAKWIDYPHQVGLSGKVVSPRLYFAIGISGAVQHIAGMETSDIIVAINKDGDAPIFQLADYAFCGDLYDIVPMMIEAFEKGIKG
ncbi:MAG TPA: electron transfer flavoprotein subunit alpha/FixB family protein [Thermotogota bacterium]|nr:electron transfer flavoprotein subunit alpha/FixB family protein [Thermotogota bacterium]HPR95274.1 electron transfer flavoprotein subunit alpha/FixB family protein [Thermotogota bacterium]